MDTLTHEQILKLNEIFFKETVALRKVFVDVSGDLIAGLLLSQIFYWHGETGEGEARSKYQREGYVWLVKQRSDWWEEVRISEKQYDRAAQILQSRGLIEVKVWRSPFYKGNKAIHLRLTDNFYQAISDMVLNPLKGNLDKPKSPKGQNANSPKGNMLSETPSETPKDDFSDLFPEQQDKEQEDSANGNPVNKSPKTKEEAAERISRALQKGAANALDPARAFRVDQSLGGRLARAFCEAKGIPLDRMTPKKWEQWAERLVEIVRSTGADIPDDRAVSAMKLLLSHDGDFAWHVANAWKTPYADSLPESFFAVYVNMSVTGKKTILASSGKSSEPIVAVGESNLS